MKVLLNGERTDLSEGTAVHDMLVDLGRAEGRGVAVALNGEVVPRAAWSDTVLAEDDQVEVLAAIGGG
jgi:sulfur carrier protein